VAESLKNKTVKGLGWSALDNAARYGMQFVIGIVLARLLSPDDYGLLGLTSIFTVICTALVSGGFSNALIRKKDATDDDYNTAFICNFGMSLLLYAVTFPCAPLIADFFSREELTPLIRVSSLGLIIGALAMVQRTRLTKRIDFKTQTKITLVSSTVSGMVGIGMAIAGFGVWSLVAQQLMSHALCTLLLYIYIPQQGGQRGARWLPRLRFSTESFHDLFGFGWKMMVSALIDAVWKELYQVVVGKFYSPATLGQYTRARHYAKLFSSNLTTVVERVTYPVLSSIQDDKERMVSAYRRIIRTSMFITAVALFSLGAVSEPLVYCMIGPKWHEAATYLPIICITYSLYPLHAINLNMLKVQGRSDLFLGLEIIKKVITLAPLFVGAFVGIMPMLLVNMFVGIIAYFLNSYYSGRLLGYSSWKQLHDIAPSYALAIIIALSVWFLKYLPLSYWIVLPLQICVGTTVFFTLCKVFKMNEYKEIMDIMKKQKKK
jgi:O-antigen/teichoic acid export membrane protein